MEGSNMISCQSLRSSVMLSAALLVGGLLLLLIAETSGLAVPTAHLALLSVLAGVATLAVAFTVAVLPWTHAALNNCEH
jgi:hypothetical protein